MRSRILQNKPSWCRQSGCDEQISFRPIEDLQPAVTFRERVEGIMGSLCRQALRRRLSDTRRYVSCFCFRTFWRGD